MAKHVGPALNPSKLLLIVTAVWIATCPILLAQKDAVPSAVASAVPSPAPAAPSATAVPSFDIATIKVHPVGGPVDEMGIDNLPDGVNGSYITLADLVEYAYDLRFDAQVASVPDWARKLRFDVHAKMSEPDTTRLNQLTPKAQKTLRHQMMQVLLADRFHLAVHSETRQLPVYKLVVVKSGPKLTKPTPESSPNDLPEADLFGDHMAAHGYSMQSLADLLSEPSCGLGRPVIDKTGLTGAYDFTLQWSPQLKNLIPGPDSVAPSPEEAGTVFSALNDLGLRLQPASGPIDTIVIDHAEQPTEN